MIKEQYQLGQRVWVKAVVIFKVDYYPGAIHKRVMKRAEFDTQRMGFIVQKTTRRTGTYTQRDFDSDDPGHLNVEKVHRVYLAAVDLKKPPVVVLPDDVQDYFE